MNTRPAWVGLLPGPGIVKQPARAVFFHRDIFNVITEPLII